MPNSSRLDRGFLEASSRLARGFGKRIEASSRLARGSQKPFVFYAAELIEARSSFPFGLHESF